MEEEEENEEEEEEKLVEKNNDKMAPYQQPTLQYKMVEKTDKYIN